jgi:hypothetical protein
MNATDRRLTIGATGCFVPYVVARVLVLFLALQLSAVGSLLWGDCCSTDGDDCSGQGDGKPCGDCPPGCPKCHCTQAPVSLPRRVQAERASLTPKTSRIAPSPYKADVPREPPPSSVFRPPKLA